MHLLYLTFGPNVQNHVQATFSILTFLRSGAVPASRIHVLTDAPTFYPRLAAAGVEVVPLTETELRDWRGEVDFFWRVKLKALESLTRRFPGHSLLYLDSDTLLHGSPGPLLDTLAAGRALMHEAEGPLATARGKTERLMWSQIRQQTFGGICIGPQHQMWNAGVVGIPGTHAAAAVALALNICDAMCRAAVTRRLIEQFALSVALAETGGGLQPAHPVVGHYWSTKDAWSARIGTFFLQAYLHHWSVPETVAALDQFDFGAAPLYERRRSTAAKLQKLAQHLFPPQGTRYLPPATHKKA